jgi:hypothetical protein
LVIKTLDPDLESDPDSLKMLDPDSINSNPQHWFCYLKKFIYKIIYILYDNFDFSVIVCKQHPANLLVYLSQFVAPSRPFVVFSPYKVSITLLTTVPFCISQVLKYIFAHISSAVFTFMDHLIVLPFFLILRCAVFSILNVKPL